MTERRSEHWRFSREIPLVVLLALAVQAAGIIWWAQGVTKDREADHRRIEAMEAQRVSERLIAQEAQMVDARASLLRIESNLQRLIERSGKP